jgi:hypothetical protein
MDARILPMMMLGCFALGTLLYILGKILLRKAEKDEG